MNTLKYLWLLWSFNLVRYFAAKTKWYKFKWIGGRREAGYPVICEDCGHVCRLKNAVHGYQDDGNGDVEGVDECPRCGSTDLHCPSQGVRI